MKRVFAIAALLMVSCGGNQTKTESATPEEHHSCKVSEMREAKSNATPEAILPERTPSSTTVLTADKDSTYIQYRNQFHNR